MGLLEDTALRSDPMLQHNFLVSLIDTSSLLATVGSALLSGLLDVALGGFSEVQGLEATMKIDDYQEGGNNGTTLKFPGRFNWTNIVLKHGITTNTTLWEWTHGFVEGRGKRRDGVIALLNEMKVPNTIWYFRRGLPLKYTGPQLNAAQNGVAIESVEIAHEGIYQVPLVGLLSGGASALKSGDLGGLAAGAISGGVNLAGGI